MTDPLDEAAELELATRERALQNLRARRPHLTPDIDAEGNHYCLQCADLIPSERLAAAPDAVHCVGCQELIETKERIAHGRI